MKITIKMLHEKNASEDQVKIFNQEWPNGAKVTRKNCLRAAKLGLNLDCAAETFFTARVLAEYEKAIAPALAEYEKALAAAKAEYTLTTASAWAEFMKAQAHALAKYTKDCASAFYDAAKGG